MAKNGANRMARPAVNPPTSSRSRHRLFRHRRKIWLRTSGTARRGRLNRASGSFCPGNQGRFFQFPCRNPPLV